MTCVAAIETGDGTVHIAADSFMGNANSRDLLAGEKWLAYSADLVVGFAGDIYGAKVVGSARRVRRSPREDDEGYLARVLEEIRRVHAAAEIDGAESELLICYRGAVYQVFGYAAARSTRGFAAIGSGGSAATSALVALRLAGVKLTPEEQLRVAMSTAAATVPTVSEPFKRAIVGRSKR
jgi:ATP-dependent protease HslVU (ClpYQ) peptidase subunit